MGAVSIQVLVVLVLAGMIVLHVLALRGAARLLRLPTGRVFVRAGTPLPRVLLAGLAGPIFQLVVATLFMIVAIKLSGVPADAGQVVLSVTPGKPADGKLEPHDLLLAIDDRPITQATPMPMLVQRGKGAAVSVRLRRDGAIVDESITPELVDGQYRVGVMLEPPLRPVSIAEALPLGTKAAFGRLATMATVLVGKLSGRNQVELAGPVGIITAVPSAAPSVDRFLAMASILALYLGFYLLLFDVAWLFVRSQSPRPRPAQA